MDIEIKLFASLRKYLQHGDATHAMPLKVADGATVAHVLDTLRVPQDDVKLIFVNSVRASLDQLLRPGDRLGVFPAVAGG